MNKISMNTRVFLMFGAFLLLGFFDIASAAATNPLETMENTFTEQATDHILPVMIFWVFVLGGFISFMMKTWMPLIFAVVVAVIFAMAPDLATDFTTYFDNYTPTE